MKNLSFPVNVTCCCFQYTIHYTILCMAMSLISSSLSMTQSFTKWQKTLPLLISLKDLANSFGFAWRHFVKYDNFYVWGKTKFRVLYPSTKESLMHILLFSFLTGSTYLLILQDIKPRYMYPGDMFDVMAERTMYDFHDSTNALKFWTEKQAINKTFLFFIWFWWKLVKL